MLNSRPRRIGMPRWLPQTATISLLLVSQFMAGEVQAQAQPVCINQSAPAPLEICVNDTGRYNVWLSDTGIRVAQYFGTSNYNTDWYLRTRSNDQTRRFSGGYMHNNQTDLPSAPSSTQLSGTGTATDPYIIQSSLTLGDTGLLLTQQFIYVNGERSFRKRWTLHNTGSEIATQLDFFHGGDIDLSGTNDSRSWRDDSTGMLYATNENTSSAGYMGTMPHPATPPSHYYAAQYTQALGAILNGNLPNTVNNDLTDAGHYLQWQRGALQPGHEWVIEAVEMFSEAGDVQILPSPAQFLRAGQSTQVPVRVHNISDNQQFTPDLQLHSPPWATMFIPALGSPPGSPLAPLQFFSGEATLSVAPATLIGETGLVTIESTSNGRTTSAGVPIEVRDMQYAATTTASFGYADAGSSRQTTLTFTNTGEQLRLGDLDPQGDLGAEFSLSIDSCSGQTLAPGGTCDITLRFRPTTSNAFSGQLRWPVIQPVLAYATSTVTASAGVALVTASATGNGTITPSVRTVPNQGTGQFTLAPQPHHHIESVTGCDGTLNGNIYTTGAIDRACQVAAVFAPNQYTVDATAVGNGSVSPPSQSVLANNTANVTLTPAANHHIANVQGCSGTLNGNLFTTDPITENCSLQATFTLNSYSVTTAAQGNGVISPNTASVTHGGTTTFTLTPAQGHGIATVSGCNGNLNGTQYTTGVITGACMVSASFTLNHYPITAASSGNGSISPATASIGHGHSATFTLTPAAGHGIGGISGCDGTLNGNEYTIAAVTAACTVQANFIADAVVFISDLDQPLDIDATGLLTELPENLYPQARTAAGASLPVTLASGRNHFLPGRHEVQWQAVDESGASITDTQVLRVWPIIAMGPSVWAGQRQGEVGSFKVVLNGPAPHYPYDVAYRVDSPDAEHDLRDGIVRFQAGDTEQEVLFAITSAPAANTPARTITVTLENARNVGSNDALTVHLTQSNLPPIAQLHALRAGQRGSSFDRAGGPITLIATVNDPNGDDQHSFQWNLPSQASVSEAGERLVLEPASLSAGIHRFEVHITDDGSPASSITAALDLVITETPVALPPDASGWLDAALPAHPDYALPMRNVLPTQAGELHQHLLEAAPGLQARLGPLAIQAGTHQVRLDGHQLPADSVPNIGGYFDFQIHGLNSPGKLATIVIPQREAIPARAVYRKYDTRAGIWFSFVQNSRNQLASAPGTPGICPPPHSDAYRPGLTEGHWCVRLTLEDGGPNDTDGARNGAISDPGGVGQADVVTVAPPAARGGRGSADAWLLLLFVLALLARTAIRSMARHR